MPLMLAPEKLLSRFDPATGEVAGAPGVQRHLSDLRGCFADAAAYKAALAAGDPLLYRVASVEPADGDGDLHYAAAILMPGRVGDEYYLTKGHVHAWRLAAEFYIGLRGAGLMLLEDERTRESRVVPLTPHSVVYVPAYAAHRTINTGREPLVYLGVLSAHAGHDYGVVAARNFGTVVVAGPEGPVAMPREQFLASLP